MFGLCRITVMVSRATVRQHIAKAIKTADLTTASAKQIRRSVEVQLGLKQDELASGEWKSFVKNVIEETMAAIERRGAAEEQSEDDEARILKASGVLVNCVAKKARRKKNVIKDSPASSPVKEMPQKPEMSPRSPTKLTSKSPENDMPPKKRQKTTTVEDSDSDMSVLIDSAPPPQKKASKEPRSPSNPPKRKPSKSTEKSVSTGSSTEGEIKHLKSLIYKCGVRKNW